MKIHHYSLAAAVSNLLELGLCVRRTTPTRQSKGGSQLRFQMRLADTRDIFGISAQSRILWCTFYLNVPLRLVSYLCQQQAAATPAISAEPSIHCCSSVQASTVLQSLPLSDPKQLLVLMVIVTPSPILRKHLHFSVGNALNSNCEPLDGVQTQSA